MLGRHSSVQVAPVRAISRARSVRQIGIAALMLAGTALAPAHAQVANLGGTTVSRNDFVSLPGFVGIEPTEITNGLLRINPLVNGLNYSGDLTDSGGLLTFVKFGVNNLTLSGVNTHSGITAVQGGRLILGSATALSPNSQLTVTGSAAALSTLDMNGFNGTVRSLSGNATGVVTAGSGPAVLTIDGPASQVFSGALQGNLGIVKRGAGTQTFTNGDPVNAPTTATGPITLQAGGLRLGSNNALGSGLMTVTGPGTLSVAGSINLHFDNNVVLNNTLTVAVAAGQGLTMNGVISGSGTLNKIGVGAGLTLNGANTYTGGTTLAGGFLFIGNASALGTGTVTQTQTSIISLANPAQSLTLANNFQLQGSSLQVTAPNAGVTFTLAGNITGGPDINVQTGAGRVTLAGANSISGFIRLQSGTLGVASSAAVNGSQAIRVEANGTSVEVNGPGHNITTRLISRPGSGALAVRLDHGADNMLFSGALRDGDTAGGHTLRINKFGTGIFTASNADTNLFNNNIVSGGFVVEEGTLNLTGRMSNNIQVQGGAALTGTGVQDAGTTTIAALATLSPGDALAGPSAIGTLTLQNLALSAGAVTLFDLGAPSINTANPINDLIVVNGNLGLGGEFRFNILPGFGGGTYRLMTYGGALSGTVTLGLLPAGFDYSLSTSGGFIDLVVALQDSYWDGSGPFGDSDVAGGNNVWNAANTNWTDAGGTVISGWSNGRRGYFTNTGGTVMVDGNFSFERLMFTADGYVLNPAASATLGADAGTIEVTAGNTTTINVNLVGTNGLAKAGTGTLVLSGDNTYAGGTALDAGTIRVSNSAALGTGALTMAGGTTLAAGANGLTVGNAVVTNGVGTIDTGANTLTLAGVISGAGSIAKAGAGTLILSAANTHGGGTTLNAGTIRVGNSAALGTGALTMASGTTLQAGAAGLTVGNAIALASGGIIDVNGQVLTLGGVVSGTGPLSVIDSQGQAADALILAGVNSHTGGTVVTGTTVQVSQDANLGNAAGGVMLVGGTLRTTASFSTARGVTLGTGGGVIDVATGTTLTSTGVISGTSLTKLGGGTLALNAANTHSGGTALNAGTIAIGNAAALGTGALAMAGGTTLQAGAANLAVANAISTAGVGTIDTGANTLTLNGVISGTGSIAKAGTGTLTLNAANSYVGGTALNAGTITIGNAAALGTGTLAMAGGTTLQAGAANLALANAISTAGVGTIDTGANTLTLNGVISGAGSITKAGTGTLVMNAANTHTGGTALNAGTIQVGSSTALGTGTLTMAGGTTLVAGAAGLTTANAIVTQGAATINTGASPATYVLSGVISGAGSLTKQGTGTLTLSGVSTYTGATTVAAGTLNVTGRLASAVTVNSGAAITGNGTVGALNVLSGGSVNPGAPGSIDVATLNVAGAVTLAGTYSVNIAGAASDLIAAGGAITLGGTLTVASVTPPLFGQEFVVARGASVTGTFASTTGLELFGPAFRAVVAYTPTTAVIRIAPNSLVNLGNSFGGLTGNALEAAQAFDRAVAAGFNPQAFLPLYANAGSNLPRVMREVSGEQRATERRVVLDTNRVFRETALDRLNLGLAAMAGQQVSSSDGDRSLTFWLRGAGRWGKAQTNGAATTFQTEQVGLLTGIDWSRDSLTVGGMFHYTTTNVEFGFIGGSSRVETVGGTVYAGYRNDGGLVANIGASAAGARTNGSRAITLTGFNQSLSGRTTGTTYQGFGELGWDLAASADTRIEPFARLSYVKADMNGLAETGGIAALVAAKQSYDLTIINLGMRFGANVGKVALNGSASMQGATGDRDAMTVIGIPAVGQNGNIRSVLIDRTALLLQGGVAVNLSDKIRFNLDYSGLIGKRNDDHGGRATLNFAF